MKKAQAPSGYQIILKCVEVKLPYVCEKKLFFILLIKILSLEIKFLFVQSFDCFGDRLHVSKSGDGNLIDNDRYCTGPFTTRSFSQRIVLGMLEILRILVILKRSVE